MKNHANKLASRHLVQSATKLGQWLSKQLNKTSCQIIVLMVAIAAFLGLTLTRLTTSSIWFDEGFSALISQRSYGEIFNYTFQDVHPPLYYWVLKVWSALFGSNVATWRSLSVVFAVLSIIALYFLVKRLFNSKTALLASWLVALSPMFVRYGIEVRMYTMVVCISLVATIFLSRAMQKNRPQDWVIYGILVSLGMWTHYFTVVIWLAHWLYRAIVTKKASIKQWLTAFFSKSWIMVHLFAIALYLPWLPFMIKQTSYLAGGFWVPVSSINTLTDVISYWLIGVENHRLINWVMIVALILLICTSYLFYRLWQRINQKDKKSLLLVTVLAIAPIGWLLLLSLPPFKPLFVNRYVLSAFVMLTVLLAVMVKLGFSYKIKPLWLPAVVLMFSLLLFTYGLKNVYVFGNYNQHGSDISKQIKTKEVIEKINQLDDSGTAVSTFSPYMYLELFPYSTGKHHIYYSHQLVIDQAGYASSLAMLRDSNKDAIDNFEDYLKKHRRIWIVGNNEFNPEAKKKQWHLIKTISVTDTISGEDSYKACLYELKDK